MTIVKGEIPKDLLKAAQWADWGVNVRYKHVNIFWACVPVFNNKIVFVFFFEAFSFKFWEQHLFQAEK